MLERLGLVGRCGCTTVRRNGCVPGTGYRWVSMANIFKLTHYPDGKRTGIRTRLSHGVAEYGSRLLNEMAHQMMLSRKELDQFVQCPMDYHQYLQLIGTRVVL